MLPQFSLVHFLFYVLLFHYRRNSYTINITQPTSNNEWRYNDKPNILTDEGGGLASIVAEGPSACFYT